MNFIYTNQGFRQCPTCGAPSSRGAWIRFVFQCSTILFCGLLVVSLAGCSGKNATFEQRQEHLTSTMDALRLARFKGQVRFNEGGSPFGVNAATNWSLGPQQVTLAVEGDVDFTQTPRLGEGHAKIGGPLINGLWEAMSPKERNEFLQYFGLRGLDRAELAAMAQ